MTLGGLHGRGMVHSSGVGASMVPRGQVIHHQQRWSAQQRVTTTISRLSWSGEFQIIWGSGAASWRVSERAALTWQTAFRLHLESIHIKPSHSHRLPVFVRAASHGLHSPSARKRTNYKTIWQKEFQCLVVCHGRRSKKYWCTAALHLYMTSYTRCTQREMCLYFQ